MPKRVSRGFGAAAGTSPDITLQNRFEGLSSSEDEKPSETDVEEELGDSASPRDLLDGGGEETKRVWRLPTRKKRHPLPTHWRNPMGPVISFRVGWPDSQCSS